jgi:WD40 repeat protein
MNAVELQLESPFYVTGGTLSRDALCYVTRQADHQLYDGLRRGQFCYVLTARQMGKSSLMVRTAARLRDEGAGVVVLDLTAIGQNLIAEQWYAGLLTQMAQQLNLEDELEDFWDSPANLGPLQRWMHAVRDVVLPSQPGRVVIFIDEIDAVRSLPFSTDEFFAAIREFYNRRSEDSELERLSFCLLGVASPSDLIRNTRMTPFNIGRRLELHDFTEAEAQVLAHGLAAGDQRGAALLGRILYWTNGHPYLTQRLCQAVAEPNLGGAVGVDHLCDEIFFARRAREQDDNLLFVRERMLRGEVELAALLSLYEQVRSGERVDDDETNSRITVLKLSGITRIEDGRLRVRNRIYERVFDQAWVAQNMPDAEVRRQRAAYRKGLLRAAAIAAVILVAMAGLVFMAIRQRNFARTAEETNRQQLYAAQMNLAARDWQDSSIEHMRAMLSAQMPQAGQTDLRGFDWYLLWALAHPDRQTLPLSGIAQSIAFSPDLKMFAVEEVADLKLWETATGRQLSRLEETGIRGQASFSPDSKLLAADSADHSVRLWDLSADRELRRLNGHTDRLHAIAFSPDGRMLASGGEDQTGRLWEVATGKLLATLPGHKHYIKSIDFSPDGTKVVTGSIDETAKVWDSVTGKELMTLKEHPAKGKSIPPQIHRVAFSPDGRRVLAAGDFINVAMWDAETGEALSALEGHQSWIHALAFSPDGNLMATGGGDRTIRIWDARTWSFLRSLTGHGNQILDLSFSRDGKTLASASFDKTIKFWEVGADPNPLERPGAQRVAYAPDGTKLASANDKELKLWDTTTWQVIATFEGHTARIRYITYSPDGKLLASGSEDNTARLWDVAAGKERFVLKGHTFPIFGVAFSPDGKLLATASLDKTVRLWEVTTGEQLAILEGHEGDVQRVAFSPDGRVLASTSVDTSVRLWDVAAKRELAVLKGHTAHASDVVFSPDGKWLATTSLDSTIKLWEVATRQERFTLNGHAGNVYAPAFSPDGKRLATAGQDSTVRLWDVATGQELVTLRNLNVWSLAFSPDGQTMVSAGGDGILRVWRAATEGEVRARGGQ